MPVYKLRSLDGQAIQPGDSGGGVWHEGVLVGNNWMVEAISDGNLESTGITVESTRVYTDVSYAAVLSEDIP
jgi:cell wall-associated NlpC family hydrolase